MAAFWLPLQDVSGIHIVLQENGIAQQFSALSSDSAFFGPETDHDGGLPFFQGSQLPDFHGKPMQTSMSAAWEVLAPHAGGASLKWRNIAFSFVIMSVSTGQLHTYACST